MKKNKLILLLCTFCYFISCSQSKKEQIIKETVQKDNIFNNHNKINMKDLENQISLQKKYTCGDVKELNEFVFGMKDLDILLPLIDEMLQNNGYIKPNYASFKKNIQKNFHVNIDKTTEDIYIINRNDFIQFKGDLKEDLYDECLSNLFIDKKRMFVSPMIFLKDVYDLKQKKTKQNMKVLLLNKYLFNNDKSGTSYLVNNESKFMYDLLVSFRFDGLEKSNFKSIDLFYDNNDKYKIGDVIFNKNKQGQLFIQDNLLSTFEKIFDDSNDFKTILPIKNYSSRLINNERKEVFNDQEKNKIIAYLANTYDPLFKEHHNNGQDWGEVTILADYKDFLDKADWQKVKQEYQKNNYYNLPNLKAMIEYADQFDAAGVPN